MTRRKLTPRQDQVIRSLCGAHGRKLVLGKGGYWRITEANGEPVPYTHGAAQIVLEALRRAQLVEWQDSGYVATADAWAAFGPGGSR